MKNKIEILAPAGSYEGMRAAMNGGCDAVYIGGANFGARAYANNLDEESLLRAIDEAHIRDKSIYLTVNTLLKQKELEEKLYSYLEQYYLQGLDAVIVQDVGVMNFIHKNFPKLPIHASTQMTLTMAEGANLLKDKGVTRLVTSRELSLYEIKTISENTDLEIETFVHGALCYCYSGQCLMSSVIGGRSGNRGRCAQPCRMPYQYYSNNKKLSSSKEKYLLSPKDINTIELIPELVEAGIYSFKIEGRMKRPEYAAAVSHLYRKYTDLYLEYGREDYQKRLTSQEFDQDMIMLQDVYNRGGFSKGYGQSYHGKKMISLYRPNHSGVYVGKVSQIKGSQVSILLSEKVNAQDILEIHKSEEEGYDFTVKDSHQAGKVLLTNVGIRPDKTMAGRKNKKEYTSPDLGIKVGQLVYRTKNNELLTSISKDYLEQDKKLAIQGRLTAKAGQKLKFELSYDKHIATVEQQEVQLALKQPVTKDKLQASLMKTGDTLYYFEDLQIDCDDNIFVPVGWLNELRREGITKLEQEVAKAYRRDKPDQVSSKEVKSLLGSSRSDFEKKVVPELTVSVQTKEQFKVASDAKEVNRVYVDYEFVGIELLKELLENIPQNNKSFYILLPQICRLSTYHRLKKEISGIITNRNLTGFVVKNLEEIALLQSLFIEYGISKEIVAHSNLYIFNREAKEFWRKKGVDDLSAPTELNLQELKQLNITDCEIAVYGYTPLMISAQCLHETTEGCKKNQAHNSGYLVDRLGKNFFVQTNCIGCYNTIYNGQPLALHKCFAEVMSLNPKSIRLDFTLEDISQMTVVLDCFVNTYHYGKNDPVEIGDYTTGHFKRGVE